MNSLNRLFLYLLIVAVFFSCKKNTAPKDILSQQVPITTDSIALISSAHFPGEDTILHFDELSAKMKVTAKQNGTNRNFNLILRWKKGEKIWMSMNMLGIEGIRMVITPDSIQLIDRLNNTYIKKSYNYISTYTQLNIPFVDLERMLWGLPLTFSKDERTESITDSSWFWNGKYANQLPITAQIDKINKMLIEFQVKDSLNLRTLNSKYSDIRAMNNRLFPFERYLFIQNGKESMDLTMKITDFQLQPGLSYPFEIPSKYEERH